MMGPACHDQAPTAHPEPASWYKDQGVSEWVLFMHPPREHFIATMTDGERAAFDAHAAWLRQLLADGALIAAGPCLGPSVNVGHFSRSMPPIPRTNSPR
jgi:hypothetical protein